MKYIGICSTNEKFHERENTQEMDKGPSGDIDWTDIRVYFKYQLFKDAYST